VLKSLRWIGSENYGGLTAVAQLAERTTSEDIRLLGEMEARESLLVEYLWEEIVKSRFLNRDDPDLVAAVLFTRLRSRTLAAALAPDLTAGVVEWLLGERCQLARHFRLDDFTLVPVFQM
jgi:hypothetical protein